MTLRSIRTGATPLGHRADGTPFWLYAGSDGTDDGGDDQGNQGENDDDGGDGDDDSGGDGEDDNSVDSNGLTARGRNAIEAERKSAQRARDRLKPWNAIGREFGLTPEQVRERLAGTSTKSKGKDGKDSDDAPDADQIRAQAQREANEKVNAKLVKSSVRAAAATVLADPADAVRFLDLSDYEVDEDGEVDEAQIKRDLKALLRDKPYLGKSKKGDGRNGGNPDFDGGTRNTPSKSGMNELIRDTAARRYGGR